MSFNYAEPIFQNVNIRQAFLIGYDRDALVNQIINDGSVAATGFVPAGIAANGGRPDLPGGARSGTARVRRR